MRSGKQTASHTTGIKGLLSRLVIVVMAAVIATAASAGCEQAIMPDLIIESVSYRPDPITIPGVASVGERLAFCIRIKNIGNAPASGCLYIDMEKSAEDLDKRHLGRGTRIKEDEPSIAPGEVFEASLTATISISEKWNKVYFLLNPEMEIELLKIVREDTIEKIETRDTYRYRLEESNYSNNTYELELPADIPAYKPPDGEEDEVNIAKYTSTSTQYLVTGEPVKCTLEEMDRVTQILIDPDFEDNPSEEAKRCCLKNILDYIHTFPGYKYEEISGTARRVHHWYDDANVVISIDGYGLSSGIIATGLGSRFGDDLIFQLRYDEAAEECELLSYQFFNRIIPKEVYDNAVLLAMEHPVVQDFIEDSEDYDSEVWKRSYELSYRAWIDDFYAEGHNFINYVKLVNRINFKKPIKGIIILELTNTKYSNLWVYVDVFNGEIFTEGPIYDPPEREEDKIIITKYTTTSTQYLVTDEPIKYTFEEIDERIRNNLSEEAKQCCLRKALDYIYTFPGYRYVTISGYIEPISSIRSAANVYINIDGYGLSSSTIATELGEDYGDSYWLELIYDASTEECEILSKHFFNWIIPKEVYDNAVLLAMEHPVVQDFIEDSEDYDLHFREWIDGFKGRGTNWASSLGEINFKEPVKGIVILSLENTRYRGLWVYVDMFYGEVFTQGPIDFSPQ